MIDKPRKCQPKGNHKSIIWQYAMENFFDSVEVLPHHLTRTVFY